MSDLMIMSEIDVSVFTTESSGVTLSFEQWFLIIAGIIIASWICFCFPFKKMIAIGQFLLIASPIVAVTLIVLMTINDNHPGAISIKSAMTIQEIVEDKYDLSVPDANILDLTHYDDGVQISSEPIIVTDSEGVESEIYVKFTEDRKDIIVSKLIEKELVVQ